MAVAAKDCHELTSYYIKGYEQKYGIKPNTNRHTARWGFDSVLQGMSKDAAKNLLDYYFTTLSTRKHDIEYFFYNYDKLVQSMLDEKQARADREKLVEESRLRAEAWRKSGKQGIANA